MGNLAGVDSNVLQDQVLLVDQEVILAQEELPLGCPERSFGQEGRLLKRLRVADADPVVIFEFLPVLPGRKEGGGKMARRRSRRR